MFWSVLCWHCWMSWSGAVLSWAWGKKRGRRGLHMTGASILIGERRKTHCLSGGAEGRPEWSSHTQAFGGRKDRVRTCNLRLTEATLYQRYSQKHVDLLLLAEWASFRHKNNEWLSWLDLNQRPPGKLPSALSSELHENRTTSGYSNSHILRIFKQTLDTPVKIVSACFTMDTTNEVREAQRK